jgi:regulation of enolase protein 1 (concanavalin A-like superfamily)
MANTIYIGLVVSSHDNTQLATAQFDNTSAQAAPAVVLSPVSPPWSDEDIGGVGVTGSAGVSGTTYSVTGSGADIWGSADAFHYVQQPLTGDWDLDVTVTSVDYVAAWTKAGAMIRETLDAGSKHAAIYVTPGKGISFQYRTATNGTSAAATGISGTAPKRIRISRRADTFSGYKQNTDGTWTLVGSATITMNSTVYIGMAVSSHDNTRTATATFDSVDLTAPDPCLGCWDY